MNQEMQARLDVARDVWLQTKEMFPKMWQLAMENDEARDEVFASVYMHLGFSDIMLDKLEKVFEEVKAMPDDD
jgi:hypothetical protein